MRLNNIAVVCLYVWTSPTGTAGYQGTGADRSEFSGMPFTILDPRTGALSEAVGPKWGDDKILAFWKPVIDGMRERLKKRGLEKSMMIGVATDARPSPVRCVVCGVLGCLIRRNPSDESKYVCVGGGAGLHVWDCPVRRG